MRWIVSKGEFFYLLYEFRIFLLVGKWDLVFGCYLLSYCCVVRFFYKKEREVEKVIQDVIKCEQWKEDRLYVERKDIFVSMCRERNVEFFGIKYEIVERLVLVLNEEKFREF